MLLKVLSILDDNSIISFNFLFYSLSPNVVNSITIDFTSTLQ